MRYAKWALALSLMVAVTFSVLPVEASLTHTFSINATIRPTDAQINTWISTQLAEGRTWIYGLDYVSGGNASFRGLASTHRLEMRLNGAWIEIRHADGITRGVDMLREDNSRFTWNVGTWTQFAGGTATLQHAVLTSASFTSPLEGHVYPYPTWGTTVVFTGIIGGLQPNIRIRIHDLHAGITPIFDVTNVQGSMWERSINILGKGAFRADLIDAAGTVLASRNFSISAVPPPPPPTQPVPPPPPVDPVAPPTLGVDPTIWDRIFWAVDYVIWLIGRPFRLLAELLAVVVDNVQGLVGQQFGVLGAVMGAFYSALPPEASVLLSTLLMVFTVVTIYRLVRP